MRLFASAFTAVATASAFFWGTAPAHAQVPAQTPTMLAPSIPIDEGVFAGDRERQVLAVQILLDRSGHSPGVIDAVMGANTERAIRAFAQEHGLASGTRIDAALVEALRRGHESPLVQRYRIAESDVDGPFRNVPPSMVGMSRLDRTAYQRPAELLAERFHMSEALLHALNPGVDFGQAGQEIVVAAPGDSLSAASVTRIVIDKSMSELRAYAADESLVATYPVTVGSVRFPSPVGTLSVNAVASEPTYHFDPSGRSWGPSRQVTIAPGPNNPVGTVWIDLDRPGFGIHGTPEPDLIGKTSSHGCVRLTNWDAEELAAMVGRGTEVVFT